MHASKYGTNARKARNKPMHATTTGNGQNLPLPLTTHLHFKEDRDFQLVFFAVYVDVLIAVA